MLLTRLMNAPARLQQGVAIALALAALAIPLALAEKAATALREQSQQITELRERAGKLAGLAAIKDEALRLVHSGSDKSSAGLLIEADNLPIAKATLQSRISAIALAHGVAVSSSGGVPDVEESGLLLIGLRADVSGTNEAITGFVSEIESTRPPLLVREFALRSDGTPLPDMQPMLSASIRLYGAIRLPAPEKSAVKVQTNNRDVGQVQ